MRPRVAGMGIALVAAFAVTAQGPVESRNQTTAKDASIPNANLRVDSNLVLVPVTVNDEANHPVTGLEKENFRVYDDKVEQAITAFSTEDEPIALGFILDTSNSMGGVMGSARRAAEQFLRLADTPDEFFLVEFDSKARLVIPLTAETGTIRTEVMMTKPAGSTALIDGLYLGIQEIRKSKKTKKALVLISDGGENHSRYTPTEIKNAVKESDVLIYTVAVGGGYDAETAWGQHLMEQIAEMTGAHMYPARGYDLADIALKIVIELRNRYVIGYSPIEVKRDGRYHRLEVKLNPPRGLPKLRAHWRLGYFAPAE